MSMLGEIRFYNIAKAKNDSAIELLEPGEKMPSTVRIALPIGTPQLFPHGTVLLWQVIDDSGVWDPETVRIVGHYLDIPLIHIDICTIREVAAYKSEGHPGRKPSCSDMTHWRLAMYFFKQWADEAASRASE